MVLARRAPCSSILMEGEGKHRGIVIHIPAQSVWGNFHQNSMEPDLAVIYGHIMGCVEWQDRINRDGLMENVGRPTPSKHYMCYNITL